VRLDSHCDCIGADISWINRSLVSSCWLIARFIMSHVGLPVRLVTHQGALVEGNPLCSKWPVQILHLSTLMSLVCPDEACSVLA